VEAEFVEEVGLEEEGDGGVDESVGEGAGGGGGEGGGVICWPILEYARFISA
jgi:hypothetical protein